MTASHETLVSADAAQVHDYDAIVIGAGVSGLYSSTSCANSV